MAFALFAQVLFPFTADAQNQYLQDWTFHTDSVGADIHRYEMHINDRAEVFMAADDYSSDSILIYKVDSAGNQLWHYRYLIAPGTGGYFNGSEIGTDNDYNYYLSTYGNRLIKIDSSGQIVQNVTDTLYNSLHPAPLYKSYTGIVGATNDHIYVVKHFYIAVAVCCFPEISYLTKYDHQFNVVWTRRTGAAYQHHIRYFELDANENAHICIDSSASGSFNWNSYRLSFDSNGDTIALHTLETGNTNFVFFHTQPGVGTTVARQHKHPSPNSSLRDVAVSAYDTSGIPLWTDTIYAGINTNEEATAVYRDVTGNSYLLTWVAAPSLTGTSFQGAIRLRKFDVFGDLIRTQSWSGTDTINGGYTSAQKMIVNGDRIFILGSVSNIGKLADAIIIKSDTSGNMLWSAQYAVGDSIGDNFMRMKTDACGNLYVTGRTDSINNTMNYVNLVRFITEIPCYVSESEVPEKSSSTLIYPNPATSQIRIRRLEGTNREPIYLYDILGKNILTIKSSITKQPSEEMLQDVSALPRGIYLATDNHGFFEKLILQ